MKEYDFHNVTKPDDWHVTYQNSDIVIQFSYWAEYSPNLALFSDIFIEKDNILRGMGLSCLFTEEDWQKHKYAFTSESELQYALEFAKFAVAKYVFPLLENREVLYQIIEQTVKEFRELEEEKSIMSRNDHARSRLDKAWSERDYQSVIELIESINGELLKSEVMKLEYSKKHLNDQKPQRDETKQQNKPRL